MGQVNFYYGEQGASAPPAGIAANDRVNDQTGAAIIVSIFADRAHVRDTMRDDAEAAGFRIGVIGGIEDAIEIGGRSLGDAILVDCPVADGTTLAALATLDTLATRVNLQLIVSTSIAALDDVFGCLDQSLPQILVDPSRSERVIALGRLLSDLPSKGVSELSSEDRGMLLRLTEQVDQLARHLEGLSGPGIAQGKDANSGAFRFESPAPPYSGPDRQADIENGANGEADALLPHPKLVRQIIRQRHLRNRFFGDDLFADPAWDILLDLTAARGENARVSVTSLCIASGVPPTTALRWISQMTEAGLVERLNDSADKRRAFISLTDRSVDGMSRFFAELGGEVKWVV